MSTVYRVNILLILSKRIKFLTKKSTDKTGFVQNRFVLPSTQIKNGLDESGQFKTLSHKPKSRINMLKMLG